MKKILILFILLVNVFSQTISGMSFPFVNASMVYNDDIYLNSSAENVCGFNEKIEKRKIIYSDNGRSGNNVLWNLSNIDINTDTTEVCNLYCNDTKDTFFCKEYDTTFRYEYKNNAVWIVGFENRLTKIDYDECEKYMNLPIIYGDSICGYYHGRGAYCDKLTLRYFGRYKTIADACGTLVLPQGDTLQNVTRLHTVRQINNIFYPTDSLIGKDFKPLTEDSVSILTEKQSKHIVMDIYRWYAHDAKYPILETYTLRNGDAILGTAAFYIPQDSLVLSKGYAEKSMNGLRKVRKGKGFGSSEKNQTICYNVTQETSNTIKIEYNVSTDCMVSYGIYTVDGKTVFCQPYSKTSKGLYSKKAELPIDNHEKGIYIFRMTVNGEKYTSKIEIR